LKAKALKDSDELKKERVKMEDISEGNLEKGFLDAFFKTGSKCVKILQILKKFSLLLAITKAEKSDS
jgi:hypothetical protein